MDAVKQPHEVRKRIGFLPENPPIYRDMMVDEYLTFAGRLQGMSAADVKKRMSEVLDVTDLTDVAEELIGTLSHGYRQRVGVAQAIMHEPELLIMDEPTRGLDPVQIVEMRRLIENLKGKHTVLISSHILTEISETCDRALVLNQGKILDTVSLKDEVRRLSVTIAANGPGHPYRDGANHAETLGNIIEGVDGADNVEISSNNDEALVFELDFKDEVRAPLAKAVVDGGYDLLEMTAAVRKLESVFVGLVKGAKA